MSKSEVAFTCSCGHKITSHFPDFYLLDEQTLATLKSGNIFTLECSECGRQLKVDSPGLFEFPDKSLSVYLIPEKQRNAYLLGKLNVEVPCQRIAIGLKELQEKILLKENNLDDQTIEVLKLSFLKRHKKNIEIFFKENTQDKLVFYVEGLKPGEIGLTSLPYTVYLQKLSEKEQWMADQDLQIFLTPPYVSVSQVDVEEDDF